MKSTRIEFAHHANAGFIWCACIVVGISILGGGWRYMLVSDAIESQIQKNEMLSRDLQNRRTQVPEKVNPRGKNFKLAESQLLQDLNPLFAVVENMAIRAAHLRKFQLDFQGGSLQLEYEVDSIATASQVTATLNAGNDSRPWILTNISSSIPWTINRQTNQANRSASQATSYYAIWTVNVNVL